MELQHDSAAGGVDVESRSPAIHHRDVAAAVIGDERIRLTEEDNVRIKRKTDKTILVVLVCIYFLQVLDKAVLGTASLFNLKEDLGLHGNQYSWISSIHSIAQLGWQPFSMWLIVRVPHRIVMPTLVLGWGISQACMAACKNFGSLLAARFFLGLFEAGCLPLFGVITSQWYRRAKQPVRVAVWHSSNGTATIVASALSYGLGRIPSSLLKPWQTIFLFTGLLTIVSAAWGYWRLDNNISTARFLNEREKQQAVERLRANQTGTGSREFKWAHIKEMLLEPKSYLWLAMSVLVNIGASFIVILGASWAARSAKLKSAVLASFMVPVIVGSAMLYALDRGPSQKALLVVAYYFLAFMFAGNPLIVSWIVGNTAGTTKQSVIMSVFQTGLAVGNIIGPLLFHEKDAPVYLPGLRGILGVFVVRIACIGIQVANLVVLSKLQSKKRVKNGKAAVIEDHSMKTTYESYDDGKDSSDGAGMPLGQQAFLDLTDRENDEFVYIY